MWHRILEIPRKAYQSAARGVKSAAVFAHTLKNDERGLSGVVVAILLILVAVLAIVLIWGFLSGWLQELWDQITGSAGGIA
jgi:Flp pilus assembly pilin Flp